MPSLDEIRTITIQALTEGMDKAVSDLNKLSKAQDDLAVVSDTSSKASTSVKNALDRQQMSLDSNYKANSQYNTSQLAITRGYNEGMISLDRYNQLSALNSQRLKEATTSHSLLEKAMSGVQGQLVALAGGAGPVGVFLAGLGPWGLAAAAGLGVVKYVFDGLIGAAAELGAKAQGMQAFSLVTGLTTDQIQKLEEAGAKFGLTTDNVSRFVDQFSIKLEQARKATGTYYDIVRAINPALAEQILTTKGEAAQLQILAAAYAQAGEKANALLQAASGRGGVVNAPLIGALGGVGGDVNNLATKPLLSPTEIKLMADTTAEMNASWERIKTNIGAIMWNPETANNALEIRHDVEGITAAIRDFNPSGAWSTFTAWVDRTSGGWLGTVLGRGAAPNMAAPVIPVTGGSPLPTATVTQEDPQATANKYKEMVSALGSAATATQHLVEKQLILYAQFKSGAIDADTYGKAMRGVITDDYLQRENAQISLLGGAATQSELLANKQINAAEAARKAGVSQDYVNRGLVDFKIAQQQANETAKQSLGVATEEESAKSKQISLDLQIAKGLQLTNAQHVQAEAIIKLESKAQAEANQVRASSFPGMTQAMLDYSNTNKQIDQLGVSLSGNVVTALADISMGTKTAAQSFKDFSLIAIRAIEEMIIKLTIVGPLMRGLQGGLGSIFPGLGIGGGGASATLAASNASGTLPAAADVAYAFKSGGMVGINGTPTYVHPAYFENAPRFDTGGMITDGGVPIIAHPGERVLNRQQTAAYNSSGGSSALNFAPVYNIDARGSQMTEGQFRAIIAQNNKEMLATLPDRVAAINRDPRKR